MALFKIEDWYPNYKDRFFDGGDIKGTAVYAYDTDGSDDKIGSVHTVLVNEAGKLRYLVIDTGFWVFGKKVLLPIGRCADDPDRDRIYAVDVTKNHVDRLPEYSDDMTVDYDYEEAVRSVYRMSSAEASVPVEMSVPVEQAGIKGYVSTTAPMPTPEPQAKSVATPPPAMTYDYNTEPELYNMGDSQRLRLYEERLVTGKKRIKTGDVTITKRIETEQGEAAVPVEKEKIVIEIESVAGATRVNAPDFQDGEVAHIDVYEERADIRKEPVVHQEVTIRKEVEEDVVTAHETLRREVLDVNKDGNPDIVERT